MKKKKKISKKCNHEIGPKQMKASIKLQLKVLQDMINDWIDEDHKAVLMATPMHVIFIALMNFDKKEFNANIKSFIKN